MSTFKVNKFTIFTHFYKIFYKMVLVNAQEAATYVSVFRKAADNLAEG